MSWFEAAAWFASEDASPAACRMSLRLAFVVYVLCTTGSRMPELPEETRYGCLTLLNRTKLSRSSSSVIQSALDAYIQRLPSPPGEGLEGESSPLSNAQARLTHAMILSLLGVVQSLRSNTPSTHSPHRSSRQTRTRSFVHTGPRSS